jgi:vitamin B12 transporter
VGYTYTDKTVDVDYIPSNKLVANVEYYPTQNTFVSLTYKTVGNRFARYYDSAIFSTVETTLQKYNLYDLNANYKVLDDTVTFFIAATNLLNEDYDDILGFSTKGRNYKIGIRFQF